VAKTAGTHWKPGLESPKSLKSVGGEVRHSFEQILSSIKFILINSAGAQKTRNVGPDIVKRVLDPQIFLR
jgi:hypothetical protein